MPTTAYLARLSNLCFFKGSIKIMAEKKQKGHFYRAPKILWILAFGFFIIFICTE